MVILIHLKSHSGALHLLIIVDPFLQIFRSSAATILALLLQYLDSAAAIFRSSSAAYLTALCSKYFAALLFFKVRSTNICRYLKSKSKVQSTAYSIIHPQSVIPLQHFFYLPGLHVPLNHVFMRIIKPQNHIPAFFLIVLIQLFPSPFGAFGPNHISNEPS